ncbi:zinc finger and BTB domain-containing protein 14-like isoform X1 [Trichogramma pretiosum]|uniref:zinc finger and BTB domain-containing protein 14-like isoform X1 n=1 Tax=Trichogramma pretiosum TaxID=7493 RepID=UPI0006C9E59A|nr:zinc finger and BTB domain-containing protein 14-like isoform X1 [Trichogramma pretiosum]XP_014232394.1 zinc finger and BTB domain-containing protein 14-like isoform X1 [Trichogramma pretiosum]
MTTDVGSSGSGSSSNIINATSAAAAAVAAAQQQQFCLRWNNFQANITSQFEALRDDEDFVDVTFACDGRRLQAHKVVLSACSPYFKELFKTNPCKHPIIFMRDVEFEHLQSLLEFMYAGEVNISQAELPTFLRTAESLQIRGLTDSQGNQHNEKYSRTNNINASNGRGTMSPNFDDDRSRTPPPSSPPPLKRLCKRSDSPQNSSPAPAVPTCATNTPRSRTLIEPQVQLDCFKDIDVVEPKVELPEYGSDDEKQDLNALPGGYLTLDGGMEVLPSYPPTYSGSGLDGVMPGPSHGNAELNQEQQADLRKLHSLDPRPCPVCNRMYSNLSNLRQHIRLIHNPQSVTCPLCSKPFKTKLYLKRHLVSFHEITVADRQRQEEIYHQTSGGGTSGNNKTSTSSTASTSSNNNNASSPLQPSQLSNDASDDGSIMLMVPSSSASAAGACGVATTTACLTATSPASVAGPNNKFQPASAASDNSAFGIELGETIREAKGAAFAGTGMIQFNATTFH